MATANEIVTTHIACQITYNSLENLKGTKYDRQMLKNKLNGIIPELQKCEEGLFYDFFKLDAKKTSEVYAIYHDFIKVMATVPIHDAPNVVAMYEAYKLNPKAISGIVNKILM